LGASAGSAGVVAGCGFSTGTGVVVDGAIHSSRAAANTTWQRISHGFELSGMLQYYSALPLNIFLLKKKNARTTRLNYFF